MNDEPTDVEVLSQDSPAPNQALTRVEETYPPSLYVYPVAEIVLFPGMVFPLSLAEPRFKGILEQSHESNGHVGFVMERSQPSDEPVAVPEGLSAVGVVAKFMRQVRLPDDQSAGLFQVLARMRVKRYLRTEPPMAARVEYPNDIVSAPEEIEGLWRACQRVVTDIIELNPAFPKEMNLAVLNMEGPARFADFVAANFNLRHEERLEVLESFDIRARLETVLRALHRELDLWKLGQRIQDEIRQKMQKQQKEFFLREQMRAIRKELGEEVDEKALEMQSFQQKIESLPMNPEAKKAAHEQLKRLQVLPPDAAEAGVVRTYLSWLTDLPWGHMSEDNQDIDRAQQILDRDHYGLEEVKQRIVEHLAVRKLKPNLKGSILCLAGPPGVGKTSLGRSIAEALGRAFYRFSLGGMRDEAEIKGHRRTYVGAMPGKFIQSIKATGYQNPLLMLDEIDKVGKDTFRGDPSSALLEVLDPEQNHAFVDNYLDVPFDLSHVMFIATANIKSAIPDALLDRMELIELPGYIPEEKIEIAVRHLVPKQLEAHGLNASHLRIERDAIQSIVLQHTREAGVRNLERQIGRICRKVAAQVARGKTDLVIVTASELESFLGPPQFEEPLVSHLQRPGVAVGLAWTPFGGEVLFIEATRMKGKGALRVTGKLGDVMRESAELALAYVRAHALQFGIDEDIFGASDLHIHFPAGAVPKDGPSAGVTIVAALISLLTNDGKGRPMRPYVAMTGEMTLRGEVLAVGGIREKVVAAKRAQVREVILPKANAKDLHEIPSHVREGMAFHLAENFDQIAKLAFEPRSLPAPSNGPTVPSRT